MQVRCYDDPRSGQPHTKLRKSWIVQWKTVPERAERESRSGKRMQAVIYELFMFPIPPNSVFVSTAYELGPTTGSNAARRSNSSATTGRRRRRAGR